MRSYNQFCGLAKALDVVGERWTLLIVRELLPGGRRYSDLLRSLQGITSNLLAKRLKHLEAQGVVRRRVEPPPSGSTVYELTEHGRLLEPALLALGNFGAKWLATREPDDRIDIRWLMVSLQRRYRGGIDAARIVVAADGVPYTLVIEDDRLQVRDGDGPKPDLRIVGDMRDIAAALGRLADPKLLKLEVSGGMKLLRRLQRSLAPVTGDVSHSPST